MQISHSLLNKLNWISVAMAVWRSFPCLSECNVHQHLQFITPAIPSAQDVQNNSNTLGFVRFWRNIVIKLNKNGKIAYYNKETLLEDSTLWKN